MISQARKTNIMCQQKTIQRRLSDDDYFSLSISVSNSSLISDWKDWKKRTFVVSTSAHCDDFWYPPVWKIVVLGMMIIDKK